MKVMVVDDSAFLRKVIIDLLQSMPDIEVAQQARNGKQALELLENEQPDLVLLDVEMPILNGIETLKAIKAKYDLPVVMLSALSNKEVTIEALELGAADFVEKPTNIMVIGQEWSQDFYNKLISIHSQRRRITRPNRVSKVNTKPSVNELEPSKVESVPKEKLRSGQLPSQVQALVIGASTGGPKALLKVVTSLPTPLKVPVFIVQHMPKGFTTSFAQRMNDESKVTVVEAQQGMRITNQVYLCPGDYHMTIENNRINLNQEPKLHGTRPAVDYLFKSAADVYGNHLVALILTGMGRDGGLGMQQIANRGGYNIAQNKETCVVYGMPRYAVELGAVHEVLDLDTIANKIKQIVG